MTTPTTPKAPAAVPPAATIEATTDTPADEFEAAFAEATAETTPDAKPDATAAADQPAGDAGAGEVVSPDAAVAAAEAAAAGAGEAGAGEPTAAEPDALTKAQARIAELEAAAKPAPADAPAAAPAEDKPAQAAAEEAKPKWYEPSDEEKATLEAYVKEWPEVSAAEQIRTKAAVWNAVQFMFAEIQKAYGPRLERLDSIAEAMETELTLGALRSAHSDYDAVRDKVAAWVDTGQMPVYAKKAAKQVLESGTPEEVSELIAEFKKANPTPLAAVPVAGAAPASAAPKGKTEISAAAKKAARTLGVVDSKRTTPAAAPSADDFEGAWAEATAS